MHFLFVIKNKNNIFPTQAKYSYFSANLYEVLVHSFFSYKYKNNIFPTQVKYSYFSANLWVKIFL